MTEILEQINSQAKFPAERETDRLWKDPVTRIHQLVATVTSQQLHYKKNKLKRPLVLDRMAITCDDGTRLCYCSLCN